MTTSLPAPVAASIDATNAGDLQAFLDAFTPDGSVDDWGRVFTGPDAITGWSDNEFIGKNVTLDVTKVTTTDADTVVIATVGGDGFNGPSTFTYTVSGDKLSRMTIRE
ncbi:MULTISPECIES: nuclear transport factor 2 family protein [Gordonia]|uniref:nuclear transport factor 2 family protein n=1 Tax=Gordonia TaxID=2053 RepID=UPI0007EAC6D0|nr:MULTISPECIES: nuclear transport factor 2 family protein [Gordonia]OBA41740.1 polyketide cyclase [Gordonia sp. 852002-51296_SCH5728562-b]OBC11014.1 polyketide cyclase [Gordonia sp. 852002-50395_SCH5434458]